MALPQYYKSWNKQYKERHAILTQQLCKLFNLKTCYYKKGVPVFGLLAVIYCKNVCFFFLHKESEVCSQNTLKSVAQQLILHPWGCKKKYVSSSCLSSFYKLCQTQIHPPHLLHTLPLACFPSSNCISHKITQRCCREWK